MAASRLPVLSQTWSTVLPPLRAREGDVAVISRADVCIGGAEKEHDLAGLKGHRLRTHGGVSEAKVPIIINRPLNDTYRLRTAGGPLKSYEIFDYALNGVAS